MDGVLTETATVHARAWKEMFDAYLEERAGRTGEPFVPFDIKDDYDDHVDGRPREDGVRAFLESRGITLPEGTPDDPPEAETVNGLGTRKNLLVQRLIREQGVEAYPGSVRYVEAARAAGLRRAVVTSSANAADVLRSAGIEGLFETRVDG
ncbi:MAG TPA: HAD family hydrolase, partial [Candidatus Dormibacteraeota bacterium]|nr:HAD family hydrolase [Candidatus Dormibacteraeota bacterium]